MMNIIKIMNQINKPNSIGQYLNKFERFSILIQYIAIHVEPFKTHKSNLQHTMQMVCLKLQKGQIFHNNLHNVYNYWRKFQLILSMLWINTFEFYCIYEYTIWRLILDMWSSFCNNFLFDHSLQRFLETGVRLSFL